MGHYFLAELLVRLIYGLCVRFIHLAQIPALSESSRARGLPARIINVSSSGHRKAPPGAGIEFGSLVGGDERDLCIANWGPTAPTCVFYLHHIEVSQREILSRQLYGQSKLGNILISNHFAEKYQDVLVSTALHPGGIQTGLRRCGFQFLQRLYIQITKSFIQIWERSDALRQR